jgi:ligand-binding SRPBCC domain-containing protein
MRLESDLWLPRPRDEVFRLFTNAANLGALTPPHLHFRTFTPAQSDARRPARRLRHPPSRRPHSMAVGGHGVGSPHRFVDEQVRGPYRRWVHEHTFTEERGGTRCGDAVEFEVPVGWLVGWFVMRDVRKIFEFRRQALLKRFR